MKGVKEYQIVLDLKWLACQIGINFVALSLKFILIHPSFNLVSAFFGMQIKAILLNEEALKLLKIWRYQLNTNNVVTYNSDNSSNHINRLETSVGLKDICIKLGVNDTGVEKNQQISSQWNVLL